MRLRTLRVIPLACILILLFFGCSLQDYFTVLWVNAGGRLDVESNDVRRCGSWLTYVAAYEGVMTTVEVNISKNSGCLWGPFGFLFCSPDPDNYYSLFIDGQGYYYIGKVQDGSSSIIRDWTYTSQLNGIGTSNALRMTNDGGGNFTFYANSTVICAFTDTSFSGGYEVFAAAILPEEFVDFPDVPERWSFRMILPVPTPWP